MSTHPFIQHTNLDYTTGMSHRRKQILNLSRQYVMHRNMGVDTTKVDNREYIHISQCSCNSSIVDLYTATRGHNDGWPYMAIICIKCGNEIPIPDELDSIQDIISHWNKINRPKNK